MELIISFPLRCLHNLAYDNLNPTIVNMYDIMSSVFATLRILSERLNLKRSIITHCMTTLLSYRVKREYLHTLHYTFDFKLIWSQVKKLYLQTLNNVHTAHFHGRGNDRLLAALDIPQGKTYYLLLIINADTVILLEEGRYILNCSTGQQFFHTGMICSCSMKSNSCFASWPEFTLVPFIFGLSIPFPQIKHAGTGNAKSAFYWLP